MECRACSGKMFEKKYNGTVQCKRCGAIQNDGPMYLGDSYAHVLPYFDTEGCKPEEERYFDFTCLGSKGITRRHGWYNPETRRITQVG